MFAQQIDQGEGGIMREWTNKWRWKGMLGKEGEEVKDERDNVT